MGGCGDGVGWDKKKGDESWYCVVWWVSGVVWWLCCVELRWQDRCIWCWSEELVYCLPVTGWLSYILASLIVYDEFEL